jgi:hypothetical protein
VGLVALGCLPAFHLTLLIGLLLRRSDPLTPDRAADRMNNQTPAPMTDSTTKAIKSEPR